MLFGAIFCRKLALLLLISPGITTSAGPRRALLVYSTSLYAAWSAAALAFSDVALPAFGDALPKLGCANAAPHDKSVMAANAAQPRTVLFSMAFSFVRKISVP